MNFFKKSERQDGWWYPWIFVAAFGVIIAVNTTMAYIAVDSWTGLETENYFRKAQGYNDVLAQKAAQEKLGWKARLGFESVRAPESPNTGYVLANFKDADGTPITGLKIEGIAMRPTQDGVDQDLIFVPRGNGSYIAMVDFPYAGQWEVRATAEQGGDVFKLIQRIEVP